MTEYYIILAVAEDFGSMDDGKPWKATRFLCQKYRVKDGKTVSGSSCVVKALSDCGYKLNERCDILFDSNGRAKKVEVIK